MSLWIIFLIFALIRKLSLKDFNFKYEYRVFNTANKIGQDIKNHASSYLHIRLMNLPPHDRLLGSRAAEVEGLRDNDRAIHEMRSKYWKFSIMLIMLLLQSSQFNPQSVCWLFDKKRVNDRSMEYTIWQWNIDALS